MAGLLADVTDVTNEEVLGVWVDTSWGDAIRGNLWFVEVSALGVVVPAGEAKAPTTG